MVIKLAKIIVITLILQTVEERCAEYDKYIEECVKEVHLSGEVFIHLIKAIMIYESGCYPDATGRMGEKELMQIHPVNIEKWGIRNPFDPKENICGGALHC